MKRVTVLAVITFGTIAIDIYYLEELILMYHMDEFVKTIFYMITLYILIMCMFYSMTKIK